jgi:hypothetical protein
MVNHHHDIAARATLTAPPPAGNRRTTAVTENRPMADLDTLTRFAVTPHPSRVRRGWSIPASARLSPIIWQ